MNRRQQYLLACAVSASALIVLAWGGLHLPFDFQPDPNYSHVLLSLHLADTWKYDNVFYPGVVNFYLMALFNHAAGVILPSAAGFDLAAVEHATRVARWAQLTITVGTVWAWTYALGTLTATSKPTREQEFAYPIALVATSALLTFNYGVIYQSYFLRPDNALSLCIALGVVLAARIRRRMLSDNSTSAGQMFCVGAWIFFMTATKSQAQALLGLGVLYLAALVAVRQPVIVQGARIRAVSMGVVAFSIAGSMLILHRKSSVLSVDNVYFLYALVSVLAVVLSAAFLSKGPLADCALHMAAGWCIFYIAINYATKGLPQSAISISNPLHSFAVQAAVNNLKIDAVPVLFHLHHLVVYGAVPLALCILGMAVFRSSSIMMLSAAGLLMLVIASLRLSGFYNSILFMPFFCLGAGVAVYFAFSKYPGGIGYAALTLPLAIHAAANVSLHATQMSALATVCAQRSALTGAVYNPDTLDLNNTLRNSGNVYNAHYLSVITDFPWWPTISRKIKEDPRYQLLLSGALRTCAPN